jgi:hypothetical protein
MLIKIGENTVYKLSINWWTWFRDLWNVWDDLDNRVGQHAVVCIDTAAEMLGDEDIRPVIPDMRHPGNAFCIFLNETAGASLPPNWQNGTYSDGSLHDMYTRKCIFLYHLNKLGSIIREHPLDIFSVAKEDNDGEKVKADMDENDDDECDCEECMNRRMLESRDNRGSRENECDGCGCHVDECECEDEVEEDEDGEHSESEEESNEVEGNPKLLDEGLE